jgi:hypothetical protein
LISFLVACSAMCFFRHLLMLRKYPPVAVEVSLWRWTSPLTCRYYNSLIWITITPMILWMIIATTFSHSKRYPHNYKTVLDWDYVSVIQSIHYGDQKFFCTYFAACTSHPATRGSCNGIKLFNWTVTTCSSLALVNLWKESKLVAKKQNSRHWSEDSFVGH